MEEQFLHDIGYNSQRDNYNFAGRFPGYWQCFTTCAWMFMSRFTDQVEATNDNGLSVYLDYVESTIGKPGIAEKVQRKYNWIRGRTSFWWMVQKEGIEDYLWHLGVHGDMIFVDGTAPYSRIKEVLAMSPVILQTNKMGGLPGGHIVLAVGYTPLGVICHDPYGNALYRYKVENGKNVLYPDAFLRGATGGTVRMMHWRWP